MHKVSSEHFFFGLYEATNLEYTRVQLTLPQSVIRAPVADKIGYYPGVYLCTGVIQPCERQPAPLTKKFIVLYHTPPHPLFNSNLRITTFIKCQTAILQPLQD